MGPGLGGTSKFAQGGRLWQVKSGRRVTCSWSDRVKTPISAGESLVSAPKLCFLGVFL